MEFTVRYIDRREYTPTKNIVVSTMRKNSLGESLYIVLVEIYLISYTIIICGTII